MDGYLATNDNLKSLKGNKKNAKNRKKKYYCKKCDYRTSNKYDFNKHLIKRKHKNGDLPLSHGNLDEQALKHKCNYCNQKYNHLSGLSRHKKNCKKNPKHVALNVKCDNGNNVFDTMNSSDTINIKKSEYELLKQNQTSETTQIMKQMVEQSKQTNEIMKTLVENQKSIVPQITNNINNKISINFFLSEKCKNAMTLNDFVEQVKISLDDLFYSRANGYTKGIRNILAKNLKDIKDTDRPFHCSDKKRLQFYVKDENNKWEKDTENKKITNTINQITRKQWPKLKEWEALHPNYLHSEELLHEWHQLHMSMMQGTSNEMASKNLNKIRKFLSNEVYVKNAIEDLKD